jgi:predicted GNAT family acetyltransferase
VERASASGVTNNHARNSFELEVEGDVAFASYRLSDGEVTIFHTEVSLGLRERGIGSLLVKEVRGLKVVPMYSFVRNFIDHSQTRSATPARLARYGGIQ